MALSITNIVREGGPGCDHVVVTYNHEGVTRTFKTNLKDIDSIAKGEPLQALAILVSYWAYYRRLEGRTVMGVDIA